MHSVSLLANPSLIKIFQEGIDLKDSSIIDSILLSCRVVQNSDDVEEMLNFFYKSSPD